MSGLLASVEKVDDRTVRFNLNEPNSLIAWRSLANAHVDNAGSVRFVPGPERLAQLAYDAEGKDLCIVLGRESSGLNNQELELCDLVVTIDTKTRYRTMNVAHALAILLYEISRFRPEVRDRRKKTKKSIDLASQQDIDLLLRYVDKVADAGNYDDHKKPLLDAAMKKMVAKSVPATKDVMLLVSLLRRSLRAMERSRKAYRHALP